METDPADEIPIVRQERIKTKEPTVRQLHEVGLAAERRLIELGLGTLSMREQINVERRNAWHAKRRGKKILEDAEP